MADWQPIETAPKDGRRVLTHDLESLPRRFQDLIWPEPNSGCWLWGNALDRGGYGRIRMGDKEWRAHRAVMHLLGIPLIDGLVVDHVCRNPACVNPKHLRQITQSENVRIGKGIQAQLARTHCPRGHEYPLERRGGKRRCMPCNRLFCRARAERLRASA